MFYLSRPSGSHINSKQQTSHVFRHRMCLIPSSCLSWRWNVNHAPKLGLCPKGEIQLDCPGSFFSKCNLVPTIAVIVVPDSTCCGRQVSSNTAALLVSGGLCRLHRPVHIVHHFLCVIIVTFCKYCKYNSN